MKPHEEKWFPGDGVLHKGTTRIAVSEPVGRAEIGDEQKARARLAAQAPAMARLLLQLLQGGRDAPNKTCALCGEYDNSYHRDPENIDCQLRDILRAAGVIE